MEAIPGLMLRIQNREQAAMADLYLLCHSKVLRQVISLTKDETIAWDIAQDVFLRIWRYASAYDPQKSLNAMAWINQVARNQVMTHFAKCKRRGECGEEELRYHATVNDEFEQEARLTINSPAFKAALNTLNPAMKKVIILRFLNEKPLADIACEMNLPLSTVKTWLRRGLVRMTNELDGINLGANIAKRA